MNKSFFTLFLLFLLPLAAAAATVSLPTPDFTPSQCGLPEGLQIDAEGYSNISSPGDPSLPFIEINLVVPPDVDPASVDVVLAGARVEHPEGFYDIAPAPPFTTSVDGKIVQDWGRGKNIVNGRNTKVYKSESFFPARNVEITDQGAVRKWKLVRVRYYPYRYSPAKGKLELTTGGEIRLVFGQSASVYSSPVLCNDNVLDDQVASLAANFDDARAWYDTEPSADTMFSSSAASASADYVIITRSAIVNGSSKLQSFVNHKISRGFSVDVVTESRWGGGTGDAASNNIRAYLKANYASMGIRYVLLIGNPNPASGDVPMKMLWPRKASSTYREAPSDYFYADLTGNWDLDKDGSYGESDHDFGTGGVDRYPEVIVGRIPFYGSYTDLDSILQKTIDYESGGIGGDWVKNVLLSMKPSDSSTPGYHLGEAIKNDIALPSGFSTTRVYESTYGLNPAPDSTPCNYDTVMGAWQRRAGFHFWWTHGNTNLAADIMTSSRCQYLDDKYPCFTFQCSCLNGSPESTDNLGYSLLKQGSISTVSASRVSWYYPGQVTYTNTDSNAGMTYKYAGLLIKDHLACGDALYQMMVQVPNQLWMNHCVFNLYGDPSLAYASGPMISVTPASDTDVTTASYMITAAVAASSLKGGNPVIKWNTNGGASFNTALMSPVSGTIYSGQIPAQVINTTIYYYVQAEDAAGRIGKSPTNAPTTLYSFRVRPDTAYPTIQHTPPSNTGNATGPYAVNAVITDDSGIANAKVIYRINSGSETALAMSDGGAGSYGASIPGPRAVGDVISYYITATDSSVSAKTTRLPASGYYTFAISAKIKVAVLNSAATPTYYYGSNNNAYAAVVDILDADPAQRFQPTVITSLTSTTLADFNALVLPDNGPQTTELQAVSNWFTTGKTILGFDTVTCYASFSGFMWPTAAGTNGYSTYWDYNSGVNDQVIKVSDAITEGYTVGQMIGAAGYHAEMKLDKLPSDAVVHTGRLNSTTMAYAVSRNVPGKGKFVMFGPFMPIQTNQHTMIRNALTGTTSTVPPPPPPPVTKSIRVTSPNGGERYRIGYSIPIRFEKTGDWTSSDKIRLEYTTGDGVWRQVAGASQLSSSLTYYSWSTAGVPASTRYMVRAFLVGGSISDECDNFFTMYNYVRIAQAKGIPDGEEVDLDNKVVISGSGAVCYVQEPDRQSGLRMSCISSLAPGMAVTICGTMRTIDGERVLEVSDVQEVGTQASVTPVCMRTIDLGGGEFGLQQPVSEYRMVKTAGVSSKQLLSACGLNNLGILVRLCGKVTAQGGDYFYLDDGCKCDDGSGHTGVRVICGDIAKPPVGQYVMVTGVSSSYYDRGLLFRAVVLPDAGCVRVI